MKIPDPIKITYIQNNQKYIFELSVDQKCHIWTSRVLNVPDYDLNNVATVRKRAGEYLIDTYNYALPISIVQQAIEFLKHPQEWQAIYLTHNS